MPKVTQAAYTFWAMLLLAVMLVGSPLAGFGCQTIIPDQFQVPCETNLLETAVQTNFVLLNTPLIAVFVMLTIVYWLRPRQQTPQEIYLIPPSPPPRLSS